MLACGSLIAMQRYCSGASDSRGLRPGTGGAPAAGVATAAGHTRIVIGVISCNQRREKDKRRKQEIIWDVPHITWRGHRRSRIASTLAAGASTTAVINIGGSEKSTPSTTLHRNKRDTLNAHKKKGQ